MKGIAFAPGHISAFFEPVYVGHNLERSGSRGAGLSLSLGAISHVMVQPAARRSLHVSINGRPSNAPVTRCAVNYLVSDTPLRIMVNTTVDLPISQGFGMSAAGALSTTLALAEILHLSNQSAMKAAHYAEVGSHTGLGDVVASCFGGIEIRRKAGLPPWGMLEHIPGKYDIVLCVIGKKIETKAILTDAIKLQQIVSYGRYCTRKILENPSLENLFSLGLQFTQKINLADDFVLQAIEKANTKGMASMCMLGNSVFAVGDTKALCSILSTYGKVFCCTVDEKGARQLQGT